MDNQYLNAYRQRLAQQSQPVQTTVKEQKPGGLFGFIQDVGNAIVDPFKETFGNIGRTVNSFNATGRTATVNSIADEISKNVREADEGKITWDEAKKRNDALQKGVNNINSDTTKAVKEFSSIDPGKAAANAADAFLTVASLGGAGLLKNVAKTGLKSSIKRGAVEGGGLGLGYGALSPIKEQGAQDFGDLASLSPEIVNSATGGGLGGAVLGGGVTGALNLPGAIKSGVRNRGLGKKIETAGNDLMGSQANLSVPEGRKIGAFPSQTMGSIQNRTGVNNLETANRVAGNVTGKDGAYSELVRNALGNNTRGIDISDIRGLTDNLITDYAPLVTNAQRKNIQEQVKNSLVGAYGGSKGSLSTTAQSLDALDVSRNFRAMASDIRRGASPSAADKQLAEVYDRLGREIEDRLYAAEGVEEGLRLAAPDRANDLRNLAANTTNRGEASAYERLAQELDNPRLTVKDVRALQKDFVNISKIDDAVARRQAGAASQLGDNMQGLGRLVQRPTNIVAIPLNAATPSVGGFLANMGRKLQGAQGAPAGPGILARTGENLSRLTTPRVATGAIEGEQAPVEQPYQDFSSPASQPNVPQSQGLFNEDTVQQLVLLDLAQNGGENIPVLLQLYEVFGKPDESALNPTQTSRAAAATNALQDIPMIENAISGGSLGVAKGIFGGTALGAAALGTQDLDAAMFNIADNILRARTGAAAPEAEIRRFMSSFLPQPFDTPDAQRAKLERAVRELEGYVNPQDTLNSYYAQGYGEQ